MVGLFHQILLSWPGSCDGNGWFVPSDPFVVTWILRWKWLVCSIRSFCRDLDPAMEMVGSVHQILLSWPGSCDGNGWVYQILLSWPGSCDGNGWFHQILLSWPESCDGNGCRITGLPLSKNGKLEWLRLQWDAPFCDHPIFTARWNSTLHSLITQYLPLDGNLRSILWSPNTYR